MLLRISNQKRQRFRSNPATISNSLLPPIPTEVRQHDGPLGAIADIGCKQAESFHSLSLGFGRHLLHAYWARDS